MFWDFLCDFLGYENFWSVGVLEFWCLLMCFGIEELYRDLEGVLSFKESVVFGMDWSDRYYEVNFLVFYYFSGCEILNICVCIVSRFYVC